MIIAFLHPKGGVGKSLLSFNFAVFKILKNKEREPYARNFVHRIPLYFLTIFMIFVQMPKIFLSNFCQ